MQIKRRWMRWVFEEADQFDVVLPWERGANRSLWRKRLAPQQRLQIVAKG